MQQLGRGLRLRVGKECLTVFDFIGQAHKQYRFEPKFRTLIGKNYNSMSKEIENSFPNIPKGCFIHLEKIAQECILENIITTLNNKRNLLKRIATFNEATGRDISLLQFIDYYQMGLDELYKSKKV